MFCAASDFGLDVGCAFLFAGEDDVQRNGHRICDYQFMVSAGNLSGLEHVSAFDSH